MTFSVDDAMALAHQVRRWLAENGIRIRCPHRARPLIQAVLLRHGIHVEQTRASGRIGFLVPACGLLIEVEDPAASGAEIWRPITRAADCPQVNAILLVTNSQHGRPASAGPGKPVLCARPVARKRRYAA
ncbi:hypothetical protein [Rhizosaccharibacter radicis]|uniref:Uncharacterized protein n=1 Tax=Rhizosaccharibacter radicis TaxID=2782605 RepID=A0ABT1VW41_9PROT|nr:hypothetical protein [Acetobacteraceae bacterium KSS12]